jgi:hypothetical protein
LLSQIDFFASFAAMVGASIGEGHAPDSRNQLEAMLGRDRVGRTTLVLQAGALSVREGSMKFIPGNTRQSIDSATKTELGNAAEDQLYDLASDPGETHNLAAERPEVVARMKALPR